MAAERDGADVGGLASPAILDWLKPFEHLGVARRTSEKYVGGKAAALGRLAREGFPVPRGWVIPARHFERAVEESLPRGHDLTSLLKIAETKAGVERAARARDRILAQPLPEGLTAALAALWAEVERDAPWGLAARSSATCEDREETSLAGLATSVLGLRGAEALDLGVRRVWASAFSPRALAYLAHAGVRDFGMAVVLQVMVRSDAAGVMFTAPPPGLEGAQFPAGERLVHATFGLGAPVVEGATTADAFRLAKGGAVVGQLVAEKRRALVIGAEGPRESDVAEASARVPSLGTGVLAQLSDLAERLETALGPGLDVEFAVEGSGDPARAAGPADGRVWVLQARPLTGGGFPQGGDADTVWSRTNLGEALPGPATPLTWSIASAFADKGFREAFGALGCHVPRGVTLVGNIQGRFYLNLTAFMRIAAQVPGLGPRALLGASGGATEAVIQKLEAEVADVSKRGFLMRLPFRGPQEIARQARLEREVSAFEQEAERSRRVLLDLDLSLLPDDALVTTLRGATRLLDRTGTLMLACASASLAAHLALGQLLARAFARKGSARDDAPVDDATGGAAAEATALAQALVGGVRELESAGPGLALARVAEVARHERGARQAIEDGVRAPDELPRGPTRDAIARFLDEFGDRAVREAELATPRWREQPAQLMAMLASAIRAPTGEADRSLARARAHADAELARLERRVSSIELALVRTLVARVQKFTRLRERMRTWVTRVLGMIRAIALDVDRRIRRIDPAVPEGGVFFCTHDELLAALASGRAELGAIARLRRAEYLRDASRPDPSATFVGRPTAIALPPANGVALTGLPASSGVVEGRARVLEPGARGLNAVRPGEVLVSRTTDVGLSPLFLVAAAVVTELGGPLSHAAVVAREYGIPAVVSVAGATTAIRTGDRVRVDGDRGIVHRLDEAGRSLPPPPFDVVERAPVSAARWTVRAGDGATVREVLARMGAGATGAADEGRAFVGRRRVASDDPIAPGDELVVHAARDVSDAQHARVLVRRGGLVIADKPAGLPTASDRRGGRSLLDDVAAELRVAASRLHPASRLDVGVSGVVVCCLDAAARQAVEAARAAGEHHRVYLAIAAGRIEGEGTWDVPIGVARRGGRAVPSTLGQDPQPALTRFEAVAHARGATLLVLRPVTGRTHQLRLHAAHARAPLFGDREHGGPRTAVDASGRVVALDRIALHAVSVRLRDAEGATFGAESPPPAALRELWNFLDGDERAWDSPSR